MCLELEKDAQKIQKTGNQEEQRNIITRQLPIMIEDLPCGTIETKKKNIQSKHYIQIDKNKRISNIYYIKDIKQFKNYLKQIKLNKLSQYPEYTHADYGD